VKYTVNDVIFSYRRHRVKYHFFRIYGYSKFVIIDPFGLPVKAFADGLINTHLPTPQAVIAAPLADSILAAKAKDVGEVKRTPCFSGQSAAVSADVMLFLPSAHARERLAQHLYRGRNDPSAKWSDLQAINHEFSCNEETHVLNPSVSAADYMFTQVHAWKSPLSVLH